MKTAFIWEIFLYQQADKTAAILSDLAKVVTQEKQLLEEFYDLLNTISVFEVLLLFCVFRACMLIRHKILTLLHLCMVDFYHYKC